MILQVLLTRTPLGLHMRAASMDFRTARLLGVRANRVITAAVDETALAANAMSGAIGSIRGDAHAMAAEIDTLGDRFGEMSERLGTLRGEAEVFAAGVG